jgi:hypothetical protein
MVRQVQVIVPSVQILVRRCGSGNAFSNTCTIAAGGCDSAEQKADVRIQLTPAIAGIPVNIPQITGGQGVRVGSASNDAKIVLDDSYMSYMEDETDGQYVTDAFGRVEGTYWGSNRLDGGSAAQTVRPHQVTLNPVSEGGTAGAGATVTQAWVDTTDGDRWEGAPCFAQGCVSPLAYRPKLSNGGQVAGPPIHDHAVTFVVLRVTIRHHAAGMAAGSYDTLVYTAPGVSGCSTTLGADVHVVPDLSRFAHFNPPGAASDTDGCYSTSLVVDGSGEPGDEVLDLWYDAVDMSVQAR